MYERMASTSSWKPMESISSASSITTKRAASFARKMECTKEWLQHLPGNPWKAFHPPHPLPRSEQHLLRGRWNVRKNGFNIFLETHGKHFIRLIHYHEASSIFCAEDGMYERMASTSSWKPMESISSASSITT